MKRYIPIAMLVALALLASSCATTPTPAPTSAVTPATSVETPTVEVAVAEPTEEAAPEESVVLTVVGPAGEQAFTLAQLQALPSTSGQAGMKSSTGKITVPWLYKGVLLTDLVELVGGLSPEFGVNVVASDGYAMTLSYDQITQGSFITYDPSDGSEKVVDDPLRVLVAYEANGQPLDSRQDGTLRLVIISEKNNQVTDGHWSVKWVERVEIQPLVMEWTLSLDGIRDEVIDRNTFQSCGATSCHQTTWTDDEGQVWAGVPLYSLVGRMDDEISHEGPAYNRDLVETGYLIELIASDGYSTTIDSAQAFYNRQILVAYLVDDSPLPEKYFPLRLVGEDVEKSQAIGAIAEIRLLVEEGAVATEEVAEEVAPTEAAPVEEVTEGPPAGTTLWITGQVTSPLALNDAGVRSLEIVQISAEHPKKGMLDYEGVYLNSLLNLVMPLPGSSTLVLTAADGYSTSVDLAAVQACPKGLLAFTEDAGVYTLVMPDFESSAWVKEIVKIEVK